MHITNNFNNISPINSTAFCGINNITNPQKVTSLVTQSKEIGTVLDESITKFIDSNPMDLIKKFSLAKILKKSLPEITKAENLINEGYQSKVYRISDNYVLKLNRNQSLDKAISNMDIPYCPNKKFTEIECYYGEPVVKIGKAHILKNATPNGVSVECGVRYNPDRLPNIEELEKYNKEYLPLCASLPQESFNELAQSLKQLNGIKKFGKPNTFIKPKKLLPEKVSFCPDFVNPNNILISNGKFKIVDELEAVKVDEPSTFWTMVQPLMLKYTPISWAEYNMLACKNRKEIFKKCVYASEKAGLSFDRNDLVDIRTKVELEKILGDWDGSFIDYTFSCLNSMRKAGDSLETRLKILEELFNQM